MNTSNLKLNENQIMALLRSYGVSRAGVFGSFARGDAQHDSDLDLLVAYRPGTTLLDVMRLQDELEQKLGRRVDLVSEKHLSQRLESRIKQDLRPIEVTS